MMKGNLFSQAVGFVTSSCSGFFSASSSLSSKVGPMNTVVSTFHWFQVRVLIIVQVAPSLLRNFLNNIFRFSSAFPSLDYFVPTFLVEIYFGLDNLWYTDLFGGLLTRKTFDSVLCGKLFIFLEHFLVRQILRLFSPSRPCPAC